MSISTRSLRPVSITRFIAHLRIPLYRNGYALVLSAILTSGLGVVYWILAARNYPTETVGLNAAILSAMIFLANLAQLNLPNALNRFVPSAGLGTSRLVIFSYAVSLVMALLASLIFIVGVDFWTPTLRFLKSNPFFILWFTVSVMAWCIFVLQDSALTGLRQATWVPIENLVFAVAKIVLLIALATSMTQYGVFASWTMPLVLLLIPTNFLIFRYLIPRHLQATQGQTAPIVPNQIAKYVAGDYFSSLVWMAATHLLPIIVVERVGVTANAYFYLSWMIAASLYDVSQNMGMSLIAEAAMDQSKLAIYAYRTFIQNVRLLVPMVVIIVLAAPYILWLFGENYAAEGTTVLRLLCLSALPYIIVSIFVSIARVQRRMGAIFVVMSLVSVLILVFSYILLDKYGITGVGVAWLLSQTIVAIVLLLTQLRPYLHLVIQKN